MEKETFKAIRLYLGMSQQKYSEYLGIAQSTVSKIEAGNRGVSDVIRAKIAKNFEPTEEFMDYLERSKKLAI
ncbi:helix-turn-helix domain-containing protein [Virgibacillus sp. AGTR]|uniref:helix-turn-helix domain-containing protein n=1 Tax=Virgibacillus sp. AGTR TaxID=2812055 RepID=UPI001D16492A|nr:helix-turn-helix transcriptional regulator [Virgibacillus sp. AGTR]MCC2250374.1 helix-turn-helix domain-containing protein [Virgibacillus sp. AGTR]